MQTATPALELETFPALEAIPWLVHGFVPRIPDVPAREDRAAAMALMHPHHQALISRLGYRPEQFHTAEQVHGADISIITPGSPPLSLGVDGLLTTQPGLLLGIYVADCGPVYVLDPVRRAIALLHSGKKGSELGIAAVAIRLLRETCGSDPADLIVQLGPCIRTPHYDIDFPAQIIASCVQSGVPAASVHDCGTCTWNDNNRYYSYRKESGRTGRMLALMGVKS